MGAQTKYFVNGKRVSKRELKAACNYNKKLQNLVYFGKLPISELCKIKELKTVD